MRGRTTMLAGCGLLAACGAADAPRPAASGAGATTALPTDGWIGRWVGVEGLALEIAPGASPGDYRLHIATMDAAGDYAGRADGTAIRFVRAGKAETIRPSDGAGTGLKWLAEKKDCLVVQAGEGFCRD